MQNIKESAEAPPK